MPKSIPFFRRFSLRSLRQRLYNGIKISPAKNFPPCLPGWEIRIWRKEVLSKDRAFGFPIHEKKLQHYLKQIDKNKRRLLFLWIKQQYRRNLWVKIRTMGVRLRVQTIKPFKPTKKFIITLTSLPLSVKTTERCIRSARQYNEHHGLEIMSAVDKFQAQQFFLQHQLSYQHCRTLDEDPLPEMGCFASHYKLWQRCIDLGEPIIILEHDAIFCASIPPLRFKHVLILSRRATLTPDCCFFDFPTFRQPRPWEIFFPMRVLPGAHGYAITPEGARILVKAARTQLTYATDLFVNKDKVDILYFHPYLVDFTCDYSTHKNRALSKISCQEVWESYREEPH